MVINISKDLIDKAVAHSNKRIQYEYNRFNLDVDKRKSMILIGTIGQLVFSEFLTLSKIQYEFEFQAGKYDDFDFKIKGDIFEIKTSGYNTNYGNLNLLYSEDQFNRGVYKGYKYCVQIFINGYNRETKLLEVDKCNSAVIAGYIIFEDIKKFKHKKEHYGDDYRVPLSSLLSIGDLI